MAATKRAAVKPLNTTPESIRKASAAEKARKAASKKALHTAIEADKKMAKTTKPAPVEPTPEELQAKRDAEHAAYVATLRVDAEALGVDPEAYIAEQLKPVKTHYTGPMLALKAARKTYVKAANGIQCNGDNLALLCGDYTREVVVTALIRALGLPGNPYTALNPGQQSMNLRNKARHALKNGIVTAGQIAECLKQAKEA
jgi:hypothetical protein